MKPSFNYYGWTNRQTWNVALWISNDQGLYALARECKSYEHFIAVLKDCAPGLPISFETPDGISWNDSALDTDALNQLLADL